LRLRILGSGLLSLLSALAALSPLLRATPPLRGVTLLSAAFLLCAACRLRPQRCRQSYGQDDGDYCADRQRRQVTSLQHDAPAFNILPR